MQTAEYSFTALRGRQAGREFYTVMCPLKLVPKIFLFQEDELPAEIRAQRSLNKSRIPEIANYIATNKTNYIFSSLTASIDANVSFESLTFEGKKADSNDIGKLKIPMDARFLINDGQHRRAAIEEALKECPDLGDESISVVFFIDVGLKRSQQMFADLNKHAVKPTKSIGILYDHRDPLSNLARVVVQNVKIFSILTEMEKTSISNRSPKLFTLSSIYQGNLNLLRKSQSSKEITEKEIKFTIDFWQNVCDNMPDWKLAAKKDVATHELRKEYVHAHGLFMSAIGKLGAELATSRNNYKDELNKLTEIDWRRANTPLWEGRAMIAGKISKTHNCITLTTNAVKNHFGLELTPAEIIVEKEYLQKV